MPLQINPSLVPIWRTPTELAIGASPGSQVLRDVSNEQERLIQLLFRGIPEEQIDSIAAGVGLDSDSTKDLIERLRPSLLVSGKTGMNLGELDLRFAEIMRMGFDSNLTSDQVLAIRRKSLGGFQKLGRTELMILSALLEAGFSSFQTDDYGLVNRNDLGELGYHEQFLGFNRINAARAQLGLANSRFTITQPERRRSKETFSVLTANHRINPKDYRGLNVPHVLIEYGIDEVRVSPMITLGQRPCLGCRDLWDAEQDEQWAARTIQLVGRGDQLDDGVGLLMASSIAARTICQFVSDQGAMFSGYRVNLRSREVSEWSWQRHESCKCMTSS
jgi:hypothetical protein